MRKSMVILLIGAACLLGAVPSLAAKYNEAPMLAEMVKAGKLPPVEERLPSEPAVVRTGVLLPGSELDLEIGRYGGTMRLVHHNPGDEASVFIQGNESLLDVPGLESEPVMGNILKGYEASEGGRVFTFHMREGLRWSDGMPVTTEDVLFTYEDVILNKELRPAIPAWMKGGARPDGDVMKLEVIDKYTFRVSFKEPYGGFPTEMCRICAWRSYTPMLKPKHYLRQFHPKYTPMEKLEPLIQKEGLGKGEWWNLFNLKDISDPPGYPATRHQIGFPLLTPWVLVEETPTALTWERNPYYFKVDAAGNQLPYIDRLRSELVQDAKVAVMKVIAGEVDHSYEYGTLADLPLFKENAGKGDYRVLLYKIHRTTADIFLNLTHPDPVWRQVVRDVRFRKALSMGIKRDEVIDAVYSGFASPPHQQPGVYDPERAKKILDEIGLSRRDSEGWRLGPDGKRFVIPIELDLPFKELGQTAELVAEYWNVLGVQTTVKIIASQLRGTRLSANDIKATVGWHSHPYMWCYSAARFPGGYYGLEVAPLWDQWMMSRGGRGEEPPAEWKRFYELLWKSVVVSPEERPKVIEEYTRLLYDNVFWITTVDDAKYAVAVSNRLGNVAREGGYGIAAQFAGEAYFLRR
jgi:peptide/nickel transport system substrate-binding protein